LTQTNSKQQQQQQQQQQQELLPFQSDFEEKMLTTIDLPPISSTIYVRIFWSK